MADGTEYRLWRVQGEFRTDFDLHRFPFDRQALALRFFNARASSERIVYVLDRCPAAPAGSDVLPAARNLSASGIAAAFAAAPPAASQAMRSRLLASPVAFSNLTQWQPLGAQERRDSLVTNSALGDLSREGLQTPRELSGFSVTFDLQRPTAAALVKLLLPLLLLTIVMYTTLHYSTAMAMLKVMVTVTAVLSGTVLLGGITTQLGTVGYTMAIEQAFYVFFALGLLCVCYVVAFETLRLGGQPAAAARVEHVTRVVFVLTVAATVALTILVYWPTTGNRADGQVQLRSQPDAMNVASNSLS